MHKTGAIRKESLSGLQRACYIGRDHGSIPQIPLHPVPKLFNLYIELTQYHYSTDVGVLVVLAPHRVDHIANVLDPIPVIADKGPIDLAPGVPDTNVATNESTTAGLLLPEVKEVR